MTLAIFTICSNNYLPMASVLVRTAAEHHPDAHLYLCLADVPVASGHLHPPGCTVVPARDLGVPDFEAFAFRYDVMEFNTALKPFMLRHLLGLGHRQVLYFDPDIEVFRRLDGVLEALHDGASIVLTPHVCRPAEGRSDPDDLSFMRAGAYNLGFVAVGAGPEADAVLRWWSRRLQYQCIDDQPHGVFVDQKFMDLVPGFASRVHILRDPAMNVAYWNLDQRRLEHRDGAWLVDGHPLGFFHFSGFNPGDLGRLTKYTQRFSGHEVSPDLAMLMQRYAGQVLANRRDLPSAADYAYGRFRSGTPVTPFVRALFREDHATWAGDPFETYEEYLALPTPEAWAGPARGCVTTLMAGLRRREPWIREHFDPATPGSGLEYADWFIKHAERHVGDPRLVEPVAGRLGDRAQPRSRPPARRPGEPDVDVVGYLQLAVGVGEAGRLTLRALAGSGLRARGVTTAFNSRSEVDATLCTTPLAPRGDARFQVFGVNADQIGQVIDHLRDVLRPDAYRIITPFWELATLPDAWRAAFDRVDEVWAPTRFIQAMLMRSIRCPVVHMPLLLEFAAPAALPRARFGLPERRFLFFFAFDYLSFLERKNPAGVLAAFRRAFGSGADTAPVALVIKTLNAEAAPEQAQALRASLADDPRVVLVERTLTRADTLGLIGCCDAVVSLHRSEGLGLLVAEAMALGKPVVATDYSATTELVSQHTGYPVRYRLVPVGAGEYPFPEGQVWADPDIDHAAWQMRAVAAGGDAVAARVSEARTRLQALHGQDAVGRRQRERLRMIEAR